MNKNIFSNNASISRIGMVHNNDSLKDVNESLFSLGEQLEKNHSLTLEQYEYLLEHRTPEAAAFLAEKAVQARKEIYGNTIYIRGLIEISNICKNGCLYCGIRKENQSCERYRLTKEVIWECCNEGYLLGFRSFVLQGGEDGYFSDDILCDIVSTIKGNYPDCAVTLSLGERSIKSYQKLFDAGADRYLLRHETADKEHYEKLHPKTMSFENRIDCLKNLKEIGYQVGCGFMVGSPYQTTHTLAKDLKFIETFQPHMCGIGPFIPHKDTVFCDSPTGTVDLTCYLLSIIRLIAPNILLPATTALGTIDTTGREKGILSGANVIMPNLSPSSVRKKYQLYNNKQTDGNESAQQIEVLKKQMAAIGYHIIASKGDWKEIQENIRNKS